MDERVSTPARYERFLLWAVLGVALVVRLVASLHDLPFSYYGDEMHFVKRAMAIGAGDPNPHWFHKPAFLMYLLTFAYGVYFLLGSLFGRFESVEHFGAHFLQNQGDFLLIGRLVVVAFGVATVYLVYRFAKRALGSGGMALAAAAVAAVLPPMVISSCTVKADVPAGFFVCLSLYWYLKLVESGRMRDLVLTGIFAGFAMGTKYYGVILLPAFGLAELHRWRAGKIRLGAMFQHTLTLYGLFVLGFFLVSPYNFLDPTWGEWLGGLVKRTLGFGGGDTVVYEPDQEVVYEPGAEATVGALGHLLGLLLRPVCLGIPLSVLVLCGAVGLLLRRAYLLTILLFVPVLTYVALAVTVSAYHSSPRHLNAIYAMLCLAVAPGARLLLRLARVPVARQGTAVFVVVALAVGHAAIQTIESTVHLLQPDSRTAAHRWIMQEIPDGAAILLDDYGPENLPLNEAGIERRRALLATFPEGEAFTSRQRIALDLLAKFPRSPAFDIHELGHQWWLPQEKPDAELRASPEDRDAGNPLVSRVPRTLEEYRQAGIRYVITNSEASDRYPPDSRKSRAYPSFARFYAELARHRPVRRFDPGEWGGKGPEVRVYDLLRPPLPEPGN